MEEPPHDPARCERCGVCCMATLRVNGRSVAVRELACRYLRELSRGRFSCGIYERRFELAPWCLTLPRARTEGVLAAACPYRDGRGSPDAPVPLHPRLARSVAPQIRAAFAASGWPGWVDPSALPGWLKQEEA